jgi:hypothetical protein
VSGQPQASATLPPGRKSAVRIGQEAGWAPQPVWKTWRRESFCPYWDSNFDPLVVQPAASLYSDCVIHHSISEVLSQEKAYIKREFLRRLLSSTYLITKTKRTKLRGSSPQANYTDRAITACTGSYYQLLRIEGVAWSAQRIHTAVNLDSLDPVLDNS